LWILGTGAQWRELPNKYPPYQTCHRRFQGWVRSGAPQQVLRILAERLRAEGRLNLEEAFIDASFAAAKKGARDRSYQARQRDKIALTPGDSIPVA
jgi:transposase